MKMVRSDCSGSVSARARLRLLLALDADRSIFDRVVRMARESLPSLAHQPDNLPSRSSTKRKPTSQ